MTVSLTQKITKMKKKFLQYLFLSCSLAVLFSSCRKDSFKGTETGNTGATFMWITEAPTHSQFFDVFTDVKTVTMFTVRRDPANKADLQKAVTVTLTALTQAKLDVLTDTAGYTDIFTSNLYSMPTDANIASGGVFTGSEGITKTSTGLTVNFAAGEFAKNIIFMIDGSKVDLSAKYGVAFAITNFGGFTKKVGYDTVLSTVAIKNKYDGVYTCVGTMTDTGVPSNTDFNDFLSSAANTSGNKPPMQYELRTTSANSNIQYDNYYFGGNYVCINTATGANAYGSFCPIFTMDLATNTLTSVVNSYGQPAANHRYAQLASDGLVNAYDPATKTLTVKYYMFQPTVVPIGPRVTFEYVYTYIGPRK
jgi:hypothetical protein